MATMFYSGIGFRPPSCGLGATVGWVRALKFFVVLLNRLLRRVLLRAATGTKCHTGTHSVCRQPFAAAVAPKARTEAPDALE